MREELKENTVYRSPTSKKDFNFINNSWSRSYADSPGFGYRLDIDKYIYEKQMQKKIDKILSRENIIILIACNKQDQDQIFGYIVAEIIDGFPVLHYVYIKNAYRNQRLATALMYTFHPNFKKTAFLFTNKSHAGSNIFNKVIGIYDPFLAE